MRIGLPISVTDRSQITNLPADIQILNGRTTWRNLPSNFMVLHDFDYLPRFFSVSKCYFASDTEMISSSFRATMWRFAYAGWDQFTAPNSRRFPELEVGLISWVRLIS